MIKRVALQFGLPLLAASIYVAFLFCYMMLLWIARVRRLTPPLEAFFRLQRSPRLLKAVDRTIGAYVAFLTLMYPMLCKTTFSLFSCRSIDDLLGISVLDVNPSLECYGSEHKKLIFTGVAALLVYVIGFPVMCFTLLYQAARSHSLDNVVFRNRFVRSSQHPISVSNLLNSVTSTRNLNVACFVAVQGCLFLKYEPKYWYWEFVVFCRRFIVIALLFLTAKYELIQVASILVVYFVALVCQARTPHTHVLDQWA